jgi:[CysO sulfur-carrier protein]-S-L-cysteine hydrolase
VSEGLRLPRALADEVVAHCLQGRPNEACGILASSGGAVIKVFRMGNASASPLRYSLDPKEQLAVYNAIDSEGWELGGVFHSHTRTAAYPSPTDVRLAAEDVPYMIVSLAADPPSLRAFRIVKESWTDATGGILEVPVEIVDSVEGAPEEGAASAR